MANIEVTGSCTVSAVRRNVHNKNSFLFPKHSLMCLFWQDSGERLWNMYK